MSKWIKRFIYLMCILCHGRCMLSEINANCCVSPSVESDFLWPHGLPCTSKLPCTSQSPRVCSQSLLKLMSLSQWCHPIISSSVVTFSSCLQSFPVSGSFPMSRFFSSGGPKSCSFSFSISPSNEYSGLICSRMDWLDLPAVQGTLKVFSNTTAQKHQFFRAQLSL